MIPLFKEDIRHFPHVEAVFDTTPVAPDLLVKAWEQIEDDTTFKPHLPANFKRTYSKRLLLKVFIDRAFEFKQQEMLLACQAPATFSHLCRKKLCVDLPRALSKPLTYRPVQCLLSLASIYLTYRVLFFSHARIVSLFQSSLFPHVPVRVAQGSSCLIQILCDFAQTPFVQKVMRVHSVCLKCLAVCISVNWSAQQIHTYLYPHSISIPFVRLGLPEWFAKAPLGDRSCRSLYARIVCLFWKVMSFKWFVTERCHRACLFTYAQCGSVSRSLQDFAAREEEKYLAVYKEKVYTHLSQNLL